MEKLIYENEKGMKVELKNSRPFILTKIDGIGGLSNGIVETRSPFQDGSSYDNSRLEPRVITIYGGIMGKDKANRFARREELIRVFNPKMEGKLIYKNDYLERSIDCRVESGPSWNNGVKRLQEFMIQLYCPTPFFMDNIVTGEWIAQWIGGFTFPLRLPTRFATRGEPRALMINKGDVSTPLDITIVGPATNPTIRNRTTGEFIRVKRTLKASDKLHITTDFGKKRVFIKDNEGVETNVLNWIDLKSTFISLQIGDNAIEYTSDDDVFKARVFIKYKNRYIGV